VLTTRWYNSAAVAASPRWNAAVAAFSTSTRLLPTGGAAGAGDAGLAVLGGVVGVGFGGLVGAGGCGVAVATAVVVATVVGGGVGAAG
jgi:hypothetical protein